jgi:hypothetical protein
MIEKASISVGALAPEALCYVGRQSSFAGTRTAIEDDQPAREQLDVSRQFFRIVFYEASRWHRASITRRRAARPLSSLPATRRPHRPVLAFEALPAGDACGVTLFLLSQRLHCVDKKLHRLQKFQLVYASVSLHVIQ